MTHNKTEKRTVYQSELDAMKTWSSPKIKNLIWQSACLGLPVPDCASVDAMRVELALRGELPIGYHENPEDADISNINIVHNSEEV